MLSEADFYFGDIALAYKFVSEDQLQECTDLYEALQARGLSRPIGEIFRDKGYLSPGQVETVNRALAYMLARKEDKLYGQIAVKNRLATQEQIAECLNDQKNHFYGSNGALVRLSDLMKKRGLIQEKDHRALTEAVEKAKGNVKVVPHIQRHGEFPKPTEILPRSAQAAASDPFAAPSYGSSDPGHETLGITSSSLPPTMLKGMPPAPASHQVPVYVPPPAPSAPMPQPAADTRRFGSVPFAAAIPAPAATPTPSSSAAPSFLQSRPVSGASPAAPRVTPPDPKEEALASAVARQSWVEVTATAEEILKERPDHVKALHALAELHRREGRNFQAMKFYNRLLKVDPRNVEVLRTLGKLHVEEEMWDLAVTHLLQVIERDAGDLQSHLMLADAYVRRGEADRAIAVYRQARKIAPDHWELALRLCGLLEAQEDFDGVVEVLTEVHKFHPSDPDISARLANAQTTRMTRRIEGLRVALTHDPGNCQLRFELACALLDRGEREVALAEFRQSNPAGAMVTRIIPVLEKAVDADITWQEGVFFLRDLYLQAQAPGRAIHLLEAYTEAKPDHLQAELELIDLYVATGQVDRSLDKMRRLLARTDAPIGALIHSCERILEKEPLRASVHRFLSDLYGRKGDLAKVAEHLKAYLNVERKDVAGLKELASTMEQLGDLGSATVAYREYLEQNPSDVESWRALGRLYLGQNHLESAREALRQCIALIPGDAEAAALARTVEERILDREIEQHLIQIKSDPRQTRTRMALAEAYRRRGRLPDAIEQFNLAAEDPDFALTALVTLLGCYRDLGADNRVLECYEQVARQFPHEVFTALGASNLFYIGELYEAKAQLDKARDVFMKIFTKDMEYPLLAEKLEALKAGRIGPPPSPPQRAEGPSEPRATASPLLQSRP